MYADGSADKVFMEVSCGMAVGMPYWQTTDIYESDECSWSGWLILHREDFEECGHPHVRCPICGQELEDDCHYELLESDDVTEEIRREALSY